jgi:predicted O-methyltransferase YrrM
MGPAGWGPGGAAVQRVREVIERLDREGSVVARSDGSTHDVRRVAVSRGEGEALGRWVACEGAARTIEIGLGYGVSTLHVCEALLGTQGLSARHVALDPFQAGRFAGCGLQVLEEAGVRTLVDHHAELSQIALPRFLSEAREFDLAFVDGNHRFDHVFVDLFYLGRLVRRGGVVMLDDYNLPGIRRAVAFFVTNLGWTIEETQAPDDPHRWVVLRTSRHADRRDFRYFVEF